MADKETKDLLTRIRDRYKVMTEADEENRRDAMSDLNFATVPGEQWEENMKKERGDRPCYEFNKIRVTSKRIINEIRTNRPAGKVRAVEGGDKETAEIYEGLIRNIWNVSDGDTVIDYEAEYQVNAGMCAWRVSTGYADDNFFDQDITVNPIQNPFCLYADPSSKDFMYRDADDWILTERISKKEFEASYPNAERVDWEESEFDDEYEWQTDEQVRIAEYWYKEPVQKEIWKLQDGQVIYADSKEAKHIDQAQIEQRKTVDTNKIMMCIASGDAILEGPIEHAGRMHPFIMIHGEFIIVDGKKYWYGITRFAKDAQRSYNVSRTAITETIAQAPQAKFWATVDQAKGNTENWSEAHFKNFPYLLFNPDPKSPGPPQRMGGADVPVALIQESQLASEEIKAVTGIFDDDVGATSQSQSGRAIYARQQQGRVATFNYLDNMAKGIQRTWEILVDLIPKIYDTERELRVLGSDGAEDYIKINTFVQDERGNPVKINDLATGRFDVTITTGPSFSTRRQEAAETYQSLIQANPAIFPIAGDLIFKSMDLPYAEDIAERLKTLLPPEIQQTMQEGKEIPPEAQQAMAQADQAMQMVEQQMQQVQEAGQEVQQEQAQSEKAKSEIKVLISNLKTQEAGFEAKVAKELARITEKESKLKVAEIQFTSTVHEETLGQDREVLTGQVDESVQAINQMAMEFMQQAQNTMMEIQNQRDEVIKAATVKPKVIRVDSERVNGKLVAIPVYEDQTIQ